MLRDDAGVIQRALIPVIFVMAGHKGLRIYDF